MNNCSAVAVAVSRTQMWRGRAMCAIYLGNVSFEIFVWFAAVAAGVAETYIHQFK